MPPLSIGEKIVEICPDEEVRKIPIWLQKFIESVLFDESPIFISDEATIWDISMTPADELMKRCSAYYGVPVSPEDLNRPLWQLIRHLYERRQGSGPMTPA
jgi:hypothetical protein